MKKIIFKKINFISFENYSFFKSIEKKGLYLFPSGPGIASIQSSKEYYNSLKKAKSSVIYDVKSVLDRNLITDRL